MTGAEFSALGDCALTLRLGTDMSDATSTRVIRTAGAITRARIQGVTSVVPSYGTVGVHYDPVTIEFAEVCDRIAGAIAAADEEVETRSEAVLHEIPIRYDGPDLDDVARGTGLTTDEVAELHSAREYRVYVIGFVPGFGYLGKIDERLVLPRRDSPRRRVPAGSVAIAESQTGIYPSVTPGGWHLIGTTDVRLFDPLRDPPSLLRAGERVRFVL